MDVTEDLVRWPKVELHRHLEGSVRLETAWKWIQRSPTLDIPSIDALRPRIQFDGIREYTHFLGKFGTLRELYHSPDAIEQVVREAVADAAADNVRYLELRFSPDHFTSQSGDDPHDAATLVVRTGLDEAARQGITLRFLCTIGRGYDAATAEKIVEIALALRGEGVVGVDLAGDELRHPGRPFRALLARVAAEGLGISVHAGEAGPAAHVWEAIDELHAGRIAHGIRSADDPALMAALRERGVALEVCPTSNLHTGVVPSAAAHPLATLVHAGVPVALSTDDPAISGIRLSDEYRFALEVGLDRATLAGLVVTAARHAFLPPDEKEALVRSLEAELAPSLT